MKLIAFTDNNTNFKIKNQKKIIYKIKKFLKKIIGYVLCNYALKL